MNSLNYPKIKNRLKFNWFKNYIHPLLSRPFFLSDWSNIH